MLSDYTRRGLRAVLGPAKRKLWGPVARAEKDYATHIPILIALAAIFKIERVLELGCGDYSTLLFLQRLAFPSLAELDSFETDEIWLDKVDASVSDERFHGTLVSGAMETAISSDLLEKYDLVFVDDSSNGNERAETIKRIAESQPRRTVVAIHDFEVFGYQKAAAWFQHQFRFKAFNPQTGVVWNGENNLSADLQRASSIIKRWADKLEPDDISGWTRILNQNLIQDRSQ